jgi:hypothetical protein
VARAEGEGPWQFVGVGASPDDPSLAAYWEHRSGPVTTDQVSFTAARNHAVCSMIQSKVTAGTSLAALAALAEDTSRATLHTLVSTGRQRHSPRAPVPCWVPEVCLACELQRCTGASGRP